MTEVFQPKIQFLFEPDAQLDANIIVIGNPETETNLNLLPEFLKEFEACKLFAFDIETFASSKESWQALWWYKNHIRLMQIGVESGLVLIIDLGGWKEYPLRQSILENEVIRGILDTLGDKLFDNSVAVLGAGLKFDLTTVREKFGFIGRQCRDVLLLSRVIWAGVGVLKAGKGEKRSERCTLPHSLKGVAERFGFEVDKTQQVSAWGWQMSNAQLNYAAQDVRVLFPIFLKMRSMILEQGLVKTAFIECNALSVFVNMEYFGMPVDLNKAKDTLNQYRARQKELEEIIESEFPGVSYTSNPQMLVVFQARWPEANLESISKDAIGGIDHPVIKAFLEVKPLNTDIAYIEGVIKNSFRGSIRCNFNQLAGSGSGRSSCSQNITVKRKQYVIGSQLQNPSKNFRHIFTSEDPEMGLGIYDSSGSHMRIATQYCRDPLLVKIFTDDFDGHSILASDIAKMCGDDFSPEYIMGLKAKKDLQDEGKYELTEQEQKDVKKALKTYRNLAKTLLYSCVPMDVKALTKTGWASYEELNVGDEILAYNPETERNEWTPCLNKFYYESAPVHQWMVGKGKVFRSTPNHRWFGKRRVRRPTSCETSFTYYKDFWFETKDKSTECIIINSAKAESGPGSTLDRFIHKNLEDDYWTQLVLDMSEPERWAWFSANIATDGYIDKFNVCKFTQDVTKQPGLFYAMQLCGYLLGYNPVVYPGSELTKCKVLNFSPRHSTTLQQCKETILPDQPVWCVETKFGTWVTKCEDYISITGNSLNGSGVSTMLTAIHKVGMSWADEEDAKKIRDLFYSRYPELIKLIKSTPKKATKYSFDFSDFNDVNERKTIGDDWGLVKALGGRHVYMKKMEGLYGRQVPFNDAVSALWLATEADGMKKLMYEIQNKFWETPEWRSNIVHMAHDEIIFVYYKKYTKEIAEFVVSKMNEVFSEYVDVIPALDGATLNNPTIGMKTSWDEK